MKLSERLSSIFRSLQLSMIALIALDCDNLVFWLAWCISVVIDIAIDVVKDGVKDGNEKRLIDANVAMDSIIDQLEIEWGYEGIREDVKRIFENAPTVDAVEVVHGKWIDKTESWKKDEYRIYKNERVDCSVCGHIFWHSSAMTYNYCPNCGAKMMDGDGNG